jgi:hypothetical protein
MGQQPGERTRHGRDPPAEKSRDGIEGRDFAEISRTANYIVLRNCPQTLLFGNNGGRIGRKENQKA